MYSIYKYSDRVEFVSECVDKLKKDFMTHGPEFFFKYLNNLTIDRECIKKYFDINIVDNSIFRALSWDMKRDLLGNADVDFTYKPNGKSIECMNLFIVPNNIPVLFCDIDGVLNISDEIKSVVRRDKLKHLLQELGIQFVLSSSWRLSNNKNQLSEYLGFTVVRTTGKEIFTDGDNDRWAEIKKYCDENFIPYKNALILDDIEYLFRNMPSKEDNPNVPELFIVEDNTTDEEIMNTIRTFVSKFKY